MIGLLLHLGACALDDVRSLLGRGTPDPSEVDQLGAECDALRAERDLARLEHAAAVEVCDELRVMLRTSRALTHNAQAQLEALRAAVRRHLAADTLDQAEPAWRALEALLPEVTP